MKIKHSRSINGNFALWTVSHWHDKMNEKTNKRTGFGSVWFYWNSSRQWFVADETPHKTITTRAENKTEKTWRKLNFKTQAVCNFEYGLWCDVMWCAEQLCKWNTRHTQIHQSFSSKTKRQRDATQNALLLENRKADRIKRTGHGRTTISNTKPKSTKWKMMWFKCSVLFQMPFHQ